VSGELAGLGGTLVALAFGEAGTCGAEVHDESVIIPDATSARQAAIRDTVTPNVRKRGH
jgi:hypothetical protein